MGLERAAVALAGGDLRLEALAPPAGDRVEVKPRRRRQPAGAKRRDQLGAPASRFGEVVADGAKAKAAGVAGADRVLAVGLAVDAALDPDATRRACWGHLLLLADAHPSRG